MKLTIIVLTLFLFANCQENSQTNEKLLVEETESNAKLDKVNSDTNKTTNTLFVKDSADYSSDFLAELKKSQLKNISLIDSTMIVGKEESFVFPQTPSIGNRISLTGKKENIAIALTILRINQTTIEYELEMVEFGNTNFFQKGKADLSVNFYLGSETDESSLSGIAYLSTEFYHEEDSCYTYIRLGKEEDSGPYLLGKLKKNCNGSIRNIDLFNFPTLVEK